MDASDIQAKRRTNPDDEIFMIQTDATQYSAVQCGATIVEVVLVSSLKQSYQEPPKEICDAKMKVTKRTRNQPV